MDVSLSYHEFTEAMVTAFGFSRGEMHMNAGLLIYVTSQIILGTRRASIAALGTVLFVECLHESMQALFYGSWRINDTLTDVVLTLMWPTVLAGASVYRRARWNVRYRTTGRLPSPTTRRPALRPALSRQTTR